MPIVTRVTTWPEWPNLQDWSDWPGWPNWPGWPDPHGRSVLESPARWSWLLDSNEHPILIGSESGFLIHCRKILFCWIHWRCIRCRWIRCRWIHSDRPEWPDEDSHPIEYEMGGVIKHEKLPISSRPARELHTIISARDASASENTLIIKIPFARWGDVWWSSQAGERILAPPLTSAHFLVLVGKRRWTSLRCWVWIPDRWG